MVFPRQGGPALKQGGGGESGWDKPFFFFVWGAGWNQGGGPTATGVRGPAGGGGGGGGGGDGPPRGF